MSSLEIDWESGERICKREGSALYRHFCKLEPIRRRHTFAVAAWLLSARARIAAAGAQGGSALQGESLALMAQLERLSSPATLPPAERALHQALHEAAIPRAWLLEFLDGTAMAVIRRQYRDRVQYRQLVRSTGIVPGLIVAKAIGLDPEPLKPGIEKLAEAWVMLRSAEGIGADAREGRFHIPQDMILLHGVDGHAVAGDKMTPAIAALLDSWTREAAAYLSEGNEIIGRPGPPTLNDWLDLFTRETRQRLEAIQARPALVLERDSLGFFDRLRSLLKAKRR